MSESVMATYSEIESKRFSCRVFRGNIDHIDPQQILAFILAEEVDIAMLRLPSAHLDSLAAMNAVGLPYLIADTLVYYYCDLSTYEPHQIKNNDLAFKTTTARDASVLNELVSSIFAGYNNHYSANPFLKRNDITRGYQEWARQYITDFQSERFSWIVEQSGVAIGFITCHLKDGECEIILNGVLPEVSGKGIYSDVIRFIQRHFKTAGIKRMKISTQVHNFAVQKVWIREGFYMKESFNTIHINSFIQKTVYPVNNYCIKGDEISACLAPSFIVNSFSEHLSDSIAQLSVVNSSCRYFKESSSVANYTATISVPFADAINSKYKVLQKVTDASSQICLLAYYDLNEVER